MVEQALLEFEEAIANNFGYRFRIDSPSKSNCGTGLTPPWGQQEESELLLIDVGTDILKIPRRIIRTRKYRWAVEGGRYIIKWNKEGQLMSLLFKEKTGPSSMKEQPPHKSAKKKLLPSKAKRRKARKKRLTHLPSEGADTRNCNKSSAMNQRTRDLVNIAVQTTIRSCTEFGAGLYEDYEAIARHKLERQGSVNMSRCLRKYPPGMTYEEIASSRSAGTRRKEHRVEEDNSPDRDSQESIEPLQERDIKATGPDPFEKLNYKADVPCSSDSMSDQDGYGPSTSLDSNMDGRRLWHRSGSSGSVQSWASSLSADSQSEKAAADFMKSFVPMLFDAPNSIDQEQKASFGQMVLTESGRIWFSRVVNARRAHPCVTEASFYSLAQHFAVALFECHEADDFAPAKSLMNMCFTFYHEVEVPGLEPYREYLYTHLRVQPIWTSMRFWTAAFFDAVQCERALRPVPPRPKSLDQEAIAVEDRKFQANIVFGQLGTFTCNMHAFGLSRTLCLEFLRKQCVIANLTKEQEGMLRDNIERMFDETEPWR